MVELDTIYTVDQFAKATDRSTKTIYRWIESGLPARKMGGTYFISGTDIQNWIREDNKKGKSPKA